MAKGLLSDEEDGEEGEVQTKGLLSDEFDSDDEDLESDELDTELVMIASSTTPEATFVYLQNEDLHLQPLDAIKTG